MDMDCRVSREELAHDLEQQDDALCANTAAEFMREDLDVQSCDVCGDQYPATEFQFEGICLNCSSTGTLKGDCILEIDGEPYRI